MALPLITKTKEAFRAFTSQLDAAALTGYSHYRGIRAGLMQLPSVSITVASLAPDSEVPEETLLRGEVGIVIRTRCTFTSAHQSSTAEDAHDAAVDAILTRLTASAIREFVNAENVTDRPADLADGFHLDLFPQPRIESYYDMGEQQFVTALTYMVGVMATDADA